MYQGEENALFMLPLSEFPGWSAFTMAVLKKGKSNIDLDILSLTTSLHGVKEILCVKNGIHSVFRLLYFNGFRVKRS